MNGQVRQDRHPGGDRHQVPGRAWRGGGEDRPVQHSSSCSRSASPRAAGTRCSQRCSSSRTTTTKQPADAGSILPEFTPAASQIRAHGPGRICRQFVHAAVRQVRHRAPRDHRHVHLSDHRAPSMKPSDAYAHASPTRQTERVEIDQSGRAVSPSTLVTPYPPGIPLLIPGEVFNKQDRRLPEASRASSMRSARVSAPTSTVW